MNVTGAANVDSRFLIWADFSEIGDFEDSDPIWIKDSTGSVSSMTYEEFRAHSLELLKTRPLPDGATR